MITRLLALGLAGFLSCAVLASDDVDNASSMVGNYDLIMADNPRKERRDDRQGDRQGNRDGKQDCRQEEGRVGNDKRECKQENRGEGDEGDKGDESDQGNEADA